MIAHDIIDSFCIFSELKFARIFGKNLRHDKICEAETWHFWVNMKVLLGHLHWGLGTKRPHSDPADKTFLCLCIQQCF